MRDLGRLIHTPRLVIQSIIVPLREIHMPREKNRYSIAGRTNRLGFRQSEFGLK